MNIKSKTLAALTALSLAVTAFAPLAAFAEDDTDIAEDAAIVETLDAEAETVELTDADTDTSWYDESASEYTISTASYVASLTTNGETTYYETLAAAVSAASSDATVTLINDVTVDTQIEISKSITLNLNGHTITNNVEYDRLFLVSAAVEFTIDGTTEGSTMTIPETNAASYGFVKITAAATVTLNGGTYTGSTDNGAFVKSAYYENDTTTTVNMINLTATTNNAFLQTDGVYTLNLTVSGGTYVSDSSENDNTAALFGLDSYGNSVWTFSNTTITSTNRCCIEASGSVSATFTDCNISVTGDTSTSYLSTAIAVSYGGSAVITGGTIANSVGYGAYVYSSGGTITIEDGTVSGTTAAVIADSMDDEDNEGRTSAVVNITGGTITGDVISNASGTTNTTTVNISGGDITGNLSTTGDGTSTIAVTGGTFSTDVSEYVANNYYAYNESTGTYKVLASNSKVYESASTSSYSVTLDGLWDAISGADGFDYNEDAEYRVVLSDIDTTVTGVADNISAIKTANTGKTFIENDISVKKYVNNVEVDSYTYDLTDTITVQITLPVPAESAAVYHLAGTNPTDAITSTLSDDGYTVTFETTSFSPYILAYTPKSSITYAANVYLSLDDGEVTGDGVYNLVLNGVDANDDDAVIYRFMSAQLKLALGESCDINKINALSIAPVDGINVIYSGNGEYGFYADASNAEDSITSKTITLGTVTVSGVGTYEINLSTDTGYDNKAHGAAADNIVTDFVYNDGTGTETSGYLLLDSTFPASGSVTLPTTELKVNVMFPNEVKDNEAAYTNMSVNVKGGANTDQTIELGSDTADVEYTTIDGYYGYTYTFTVPRNYTYALTFTGDGYRTCSVNITPSDTTSSVTVWNNVMSNPAAVVSGGTGTEELNVTFLAGDIVMDYEINLYDLSAVVSYFGKDVTTSESQYICYDLNRDGRIDSRDIAMVLVSWNY